MRKIFIRRGCIALFLLLFLFLCVPVLLSTTTKSLAAHVDVTVLPTIIITTKPDPISTTRPKPSPTPRPKPSPTATPRPKPTATPLPTATPRPSPTVGITPTVTVKPPPVPTQKPRPVATPKAHPTPTAITKQPTTVPVATTRPTTASSKPDPVRDNVPMMPLVIGTLLTLCLGAASFIGIRRVRTALLPAVAVKHQHTAPSVQSWQRIRTVQTPAPPLATQETLPFSQLHSFSPPQEAVAPSTHINKVKQTQNGPQTGSHRRLGPVRLRKMAQNEAVQPEPPKAKHILPADFEDMSFLNDPFLQDTLRHYRQKGQKD